MRIYDYRRDQAIDYAHRWAFARNPRYLDFQTLGGDCTNFASQCIFAGSGVMNYTEILGWYYRSASSRSPSWTGVEFLHNFLAKNKGPGPFAVITDISQAKPGDIIQLRFSGNVFQHSPVVVETGESPNIQNILVAAHTFDADYRPLSSYSYSEMRCIHILGVRK